MFALRFPRTARTVYRVQYDPGRAAASVPINSASRQQEPRAVIRKY